MPNNQGERVLSAAGTVPIRIQDGTPQVLLVHRPRYDDWSLPKGKLNPDEYLAACAVRETREETGIQVRLGMPLDKVSYEIGTGIKSVNYWRAEVRKKRAFVPTDEVDKIRWLDVDKAVAKASYPEEPALIRQAVAMVATTPLLIVRHAKAMLRSNWNGRDQARPLDERGRRQSRLLIPLLAAYGVRRLVSSTSTRCTRTLTPYAQDRKLDIEGWTTLSEEQAVKSPAQVGALVRRLADETVASGKPLAICGHRPVLPSMLEALGLPNRHMQPGAVMIAHLDATGQTVAIEFHKPRV